MHAFCTLCLCDVDISGIGKNAVEMLQINKVTVLIFCVQFDHLKITKYWRPNCVVYHAVKHHQSCTSVNCGVIVDKYIVTHR